MNKNLLALLMIILAVLIYPFFIVPLQSDVVLVKAEIQTLDESISIAKKFGEKKDELVKKSRQFSSNDIDNLNQLIPDALDRLRFLADIEALAKVNKLEINGGIDISLGNVEKKKVKIEESSNEDVEQITVGFKIQGNYNDFLNYLGDLSKSRSLVDFDSISFSTSRAVEGSIAQDFSYNVVVRTYVFKNNDI